MATNNIMPDFQSMVGTGTVTLSEKGETKSAKNKTSAASVSAVKNLPISGMQACNGITLKSDQETIVTVASCKSGQVFICPGGQEECNKDIFEPTEVSNGVMQMRVGDFNYRVELTAEQMIYSIQKKPCLVPYPHGCLVNGPGWEDSLVYTFKKQ